jgi:hypothetical protein
MESWLPQAHAAQTQLAAFLGGKKGAIAIICLPQVCVTKRSTFWSTFVLYKNDDGFTKTGSGQTLGKALKQSIVCSPPQGKAEDDLPGSATTRLDGEYLLAVRKHFSLCLSRACLGKIIIFIH